VQADSGTYKSDESQFGKYAKFILDTNVLIGGRVRMRQLRVKPMACERSPPKLKNFTKVTTACCNIVIRHAIVDTAGPYEFHARIHAVVRESASRQHSSRLAALRPTG
jgi:hypothetical protein